MQGFGNLVDGVEGTYIVGAPSSPIPDGGAPSHWRFIGRPQCGATDSVRHRPDAGCQP